MADKGIFNSSVNFFSDKQLDSPIIGIKEQKFYQTYLHLKSQYQLLLSLNQSLKNWYEAHSDDDANLSIHKLIEQMQVVINCSYGKLQQATFDLMHVLKQYSENNAISKIVNRIFMAVASIARILSKPMTQAEQSILSMPQDDESIIKYSEPDIKPFSSNDVIMCRICDAMIPLSCIEEHTATCIESFQKEAKIFRIQKQMEELHSYSILNLLNEKWPGEESQAIRVILPTLAVANKLWRAIEIDINSDESTSQLDRIYTQLGFLMSLRQNHDLLNRSRKLIFEKMKLCKQLHKAREVLLRTRITKSQPSYGYASICDFEFISRISAGAYARVFLAKKITTGDLYAIKVQRIEDIQQKNQIKRVMLEKNILFSFHNPYLIDFYYSFIGDSNIYLVMEYLPGGDLYSLLSKVGALDEESAKIYTYQVANALNYLHSNGIIHRDLKPDNILISAEGKLKLTDFGLSYFGVEGRRQASDSIIQSNSLVGTPDYIAPEIILCVPHTFTVDYWSLGCLVYELVVGVPPFHGNTERQTYANILKSSYEPPEDVSEECKDFISKLLQTEPSARLGASDPQEIFNHPWLRGVDDSTPPPFRPTLSSSTSTEYFEQRPTVFTEGDADIIEDIQASRPRAVRRYSDPSTHQRRRSEFAFSWGMDELEGFPSTQVKMLGEATLGAAKKLKPTRRGALPLGNGISLKEVKDCPRDAIGSAGSFERIPLAEGINRIPIPPLF